MKELNIERIMMLYFETRRKRELAANRENPREFINQDFRLSGIIDCLAIITNIPLRKLETKYSYLL